MLIQGGRFRVEAEAGRGGMATVFRAHDSLTGEPVALKILNALGLTPADRFEQEATLLAQLRHPAIVRYVDHGVTAAGEQFLAMEWLEGETLDQRLAAGPLGLVATLELGRRVLDALGVAHERGVVHRDLKPSNLFLPGGSLANLKLLDFGVARRVDAGRMTKTGMTVGTPMYMSPEQARGDRAIDPRSDFFALAAILIECLAGVSPFAGETPLAMMMKICLEEVNVAGLCPDAPRPLVDLLTRMLAKRAADRPASAAGLVAQLDQILRALPALGFAATEEGPALEVRPPRPGLTLEQRVLSVILLWSPAAAPHGDATDDDAPYLAASELLEALGPRVHRFAGGAILLTLQGRGTPADQAIQAARCALQLQARLPGVVLAVGTGRAMLGGELPAGEVIDRVAMLLEGQPPGTIVVDGMTAALLGDAFEVRPASGALRLLLERPLAEPSRALLGKELPCLGRERELATLLALYEECVGESVARTVLVTAPAGAGKSRVRREFLQRVDRGAHDFDLLIGRGDAIRAGAPFGMLGPALRAAAGITGGEPAADQRRQFLLWVGRHLPAASVARVAAFLGEMAGISFSEDEVPALRSARQDPRVMADQMLVSWLDWIEAAARSGPLILVLEDLHWGDVPTVEFVDAALRALRDQPFMVLALARPEVEERFAGLWGERNPQRISLPPLTSRSCQKLIQQVLPDLSTSRTAWIVERADGNPFYLEELLRAVSAEADDARLLGSLPDTVLGMVQARFDALGTQVRQVLRAASVFGQTFRADGLAALVPDSPAVDSALEVLRGREVIVSRPGSGDQEFAFRHALLRDAAYELLTDEDRRLAHRLAGEFLESRDEREAIVLVEHFERGGEPVRAAHHCARAAAQALEANDVAGAIERVARGVRDGAQGETLGTMRLVEAQARNWIGQFADAAGAARAAITRLQAAARLHAAGELITALGFQGRFAEIEAALGEARSWPEASEHLSAWQQAVLRAAAFLPSGGQRELTEHLLGELDQRALADPAIAAPWHKAWGLMTLGTQPGVAAHHFERSLEAFEAIANFRETFEARLNVAAALGTVGKLEESEGHFRELLAVAERMNLQSLEPVMLQNLGIIRADLGALDDAAGLIAAALVAARRQGDPRVEGNCHHTLGVIDSRAGRFRSAEEHARAAVVNAVAAVRPLAIAGLAEALLGQHRIAEALEQARQANRILEEQGYVEDGEALVRLSLAECLVAAGDPVAAREAGLRAYRRLLERAAAIEEPELRASFLTALPDHRRTVDLARQLGLAGDPN